MKKILLAGCSLLMLTSVQMAQAAATSYNVTTTFLEPATQPYDTIFIGSFTYDDVTKTVSGLNGSLSESMTGAATGSMNWLSLNNQLSSIYDATLGGLLVTTFLNTNTNTFSTAGGGDGWAPGSGFGEYYGADTGGANPGNAYVRIFVNTLDPLAALTQAQMDKLAYADCAAGGMMDTLCMTGTTVAGYGSIGSMGGYPVSQTITAVAPVPEPSTNALILIGLGLVGFLAARRNKQGDLTGSFA